MNLNEFKKVMGSLDGLMPKEHIDTITEAFEILKEFQIFCQKKYELSDEGFEMMWNLRIELVDAKKVMPHVIACFDDIEDLLNDINHPSEPFKQIQNAYLPAFEKDNDFEKFDEAIKSMALAIVFEILSKLT